MKRIDLNADVGESRAPNEAEIIREITSASIACGGHAGDASTMHLALTQCRVHGVAAGAHPSYPDREHFGRVSLAIPLAELTKSIATQFHALQDVARELGIAITHLKPHGALYNDAAQNPQLARAIADAVRDHPDLILYGLRGSVMLEVFREAGFRTASEVFADRGYRPDGTLLPRTLQGALLMHPAEAAANAVQLASAGADTVCVHSDTPGALAIVHQVRRELARSGFLISPL